MKKSFSLLLTLVLIAFAATLINCGDSRHVTPVSQTYPFAFIRDAGVTGPILARETKGVPRLRAHRQHQRGVGLQPWANDIDPGSDSVVVMNNDGSSETVVVNQGGWFEAIDMSVDGKTAVFSAEVTGTDGTYLQIFIAKGSTGSYTVTQLTSDAEDHFDPKLSSDGSNIVFIKELGLTQAYVMSASGGTETVIPTPETEYVYSATFMPDGNAIVYEDCGLDSINMINLDGSGEVVLNDPADNGASLDDTPSVSPDGTKVVFLQDNNVVVMDITGQNVTQLTTDGVNDDPMFVNDRIVYVSWKDNAGATELYSMKTDGASQKRLTNNTANEWFEITDNVLY